MIYRVVAPQYTGKKVVQELWQVLLYERGLGHEKAMRPSVWLCEIQAYTIVYASCLIAPFALIAETGNATWQT